MFYSCPNETVTFTCNGSQVEAMDWIVENYVPEDDEHVYIVAFLNEPTINHTRFIPSKVTNISKRNESVADMEISLTVQSFGVQNETKITCIENC